MSRARGSSGSRSSSCRRPSRPATRKARRRRPGPPDAARGDSPFRHRDFVVFLGVMLATGFAIEMSFVAIGWQVYAVHSNPLDLGLVGLAMFIPLPLLALPAGHLADRFPRRTLLAIATARRRGRHGRVALRHPRRSRFDVAVLPARVRHRRRVGARCPCLAGADAVARPARDPRAGARPAVDRVPGLRDRRARDRRPPVCDPLGARLRRCGGAVGPLPRRVAVPPHRA